MGWALAFYSLDLQQQDCSANDAVSCSGWKLTSERATLTPVSRTEGHLMNSCVEGRGRLEFDATGASCSMNLARVHLLEVSCFTTESEPCLCCC